MLQSVILLLKMRVPGRNVSLCFGLWNPPTASLPNCISASRVASWRKTQHISCHSSSCVLIPVCVVNLATCVCVKSEEEGPGEKKTLQYFEFGLQYIVQPLGVNPTYSTFNEWMNRWLKWFNLGIKHCSVAQRNKNVLLQLWLELFSSAKQKKKDNFMSKM